MVLGIDDAVCVFNLVEEEFTRDQARRVIEQIRLAAAGDSKCRIQPASNERQLPVPTKDILNFPPVASIPVSSPWESWTDWKQQFVVGYHPAKRLVRVWRYWAIEGCEALNGIWEIPDWDLDK